VRRPTRHVRKPKITPAVLAAYQLVIERGNELPDDHSAECDRQPFYQPELALEKLLNRKPWQPTISETFGCDEPPSWMTNPLHRVEWMKARELRLAIDEVYYATPAST
jgi:hypothetical protein